MTTTRPEGLQAIDREMARQHADALASFHANGEMAVKAAASSENRMLQARLNTWRQFSSKQRRVVMGDLPST